MFLSTNTVSMFGDKGKHTRKIPRLTVIYRTGSLMRLQVLITGGKKTQKKNRILSFCSGKESLAAISEGAKSYETSVLH